MFEHRSKPLLPRREFYARLARSTGIGLLVIAFALGIGMIGYRAFEPMSWVDAFVNAAMILSGMGPDVVLIVCKPFQGQHIMRAYGFDSGELIHGISGGSTCEMVSSYVVRSGKPTFTLGDTGGNAGLALEPDEVVLAFPYDKMGIAVANLPRICRTSTMHRHNIVHER